MTTLLRDASHEYQQSPRKFLARPSWLQRAARMRVVRPSLERTAPEAEPVFARVNHGLWIADCPCKGSMAVWLPETTDDGQQTTSWFWCSSCANADLKGALRPVVFPEALKRARIEQALAHRPIANQNWFPGELIGALRNENRYHDLPLTATTDDGPQTTEARAIPSSVVRGPSSGAAR